MHEEKSPELIRETGKAKDGSRLGVFKCGYCGTEWETRLRSVKAGSTRSCGCLQKEAVRQTGYKNKIHGMANSAEFAIWSTMIQRCYNPNNTEYKRYGERGITVCDEWRKSFINFYNDMGPRPSPELSIDRIDNNKNYCKENCRWVTDEEQQNNKRNNKPLTLEGETKTLARWSRDTGIDRETIARRLKLGWSEEEALTTPVKPTERLIEFNGKTQNLSQWSKELGISLTCLLKRLDDKKMSVEEAFTTPLAGKGQMITYNGKTQNLAAWSKELGINLDTLTYRLKVGKPLEEVFCQEDTRTRKRK